MLVCVFLASCQEKQVRELRGGKIGCEDAQDTGLNEG